MRAVTSAGAVSGRPSGQRRRRASESKTMYVRAGLSLRALSDKGLRVPVSEQLGLVAGGAPSSYHKARPHQPQHPARDVQQHVLPSAGYSLALGHRCPLFFRLWRPCSERITSPAAARPIIINHLSLKHGPRRASISRGR
jgi:hypothetical protein